MLKKIFNLLKFLWFHPLNRNDRLVSLWRVISLQIASRIINGPIMLPFVNGTYLLTSHGMTGATGEWYCGLREYEDMGFLLHVLQPGDLFVDVGANIGSYSILAGSCQGVNVLAFEPIPSTFYWLQKNIKINALDNQVSAINIGLAEQKDTINFSLNLDILNHILLKNEKNFPSIEIDVQTLDNVLKEKNPTVIKIDVEGYESQVLAGAQNIINNPSLIAVIVELNGSGKRYGKDDNDIHKLLIRKGFDSYQYDPTSHQLKSLQGKYKQISNTLYLRKLDEIHRRISRKTTFTLGTGTRI
jgi:FkbM family methyltransferase